MQRDKSENITTLVDVFKTSKPFRYAHGRNP